MKNLLPLLILLLIIACQQTETSTQLSQATNKAVKYNSKIASELANRAALDQTAAWLPEGKFEDYTKEEWEAYKDSVFTTNKTYLEKVLNEHGFPGIDLVGEEGAHDFWLMAQHCDFDPDFQNRVLEKMKIEVDKNNVNKSNYAYLVDRVRKNTGQKILYGTQVRYNRNTGQAYPKPLEDSANVNQRRKEVGLEPLEEYLNRMTISHFDMNRENMLSRGVTEPKLYSVPE